MRARSVALVVLLDAFARLATADESLDVDDGAGAKPHVEANGYLDGRLQYAHVSPNGIVPARDLPSLSTLLEANVELRAPVARPLFAYTDLSLFVQGGTLFYERDVDGRDVRVPDHAVAALAPRAVPSELYADFSPRPWLSLVAGRKRVVWGSGVAFNPTDLLNPPKDPTAPTLQRAGAWMFRGEARFEKFTVTALASPVLDAEGAFATGRYLAAARVYALVANADLNAVYYFSNRYTSDDDFRTKSQLGLSASRYFFDDWELHAEARLTVGTARRYGALAAANGAWPSLDTPRALLDAVLPQSRIDSDAFLPRVLAGTRRSFSDESTLSVEYYFQADGYTQRELNDFLRVAREANTRGVSTALLSGAASTSSSQGLPQRFTFEPLRQHYLIASYSKPKLFEDWTASLTVIAGLADLSGLVSPAVTFSPEQWLTLTAAAFVPLGALPVGRSCAVAAPGNRCPPSESFSEFSLLPEDARVVLEARAFY